MRHERERITDRLFSKNPREVEAAEDVDAAIRGHWLEVCESFPNATTPQVATKTAEDFGVSVARVFESFKPRAESV